MVHELHRLWRVQRDLMLEYERNPLLRNSSSSSPIHTNQHSTNESSPVFYSNQNRPNFEFVREGSAQSSANIVPAKRPMFDLRLPASEYIENKNGLETGFGLGSAVSCFNKGGAVGTVNGVGTSRSERNFFLSDLNEPVAETTGLDFLGVNRELVRHRQADEGSSSGLFFANGKRANDELSLGKEKGGKSSGAHFFSPDRNHINFTSGSNPLGSNIFSTYGSQQNSFRDQNAVAPQLFGQKLTYSFDPSQAQSSNIFSSNNSSDNNYNSNNPVAPTSFPILDSSPHCNNLNKNKGLMAGSMHPLLSPFVNNASGTTTIGSGAGDNSGFFFNAPRNLVFGSSGGHHQSIDFSKSSWNKNIAPGLDMDLNEPIPEENQETKGIKLFGTNCSSLVSEPSWPKNEIDLNNLAIEDDISQKASSSASVIAGEPNSSNTKLLGFPFFGNSSSSNNKSTLHADESNKSEGRVNDDKHVDSAKRVLIIDLNEDLPLENDLDISKERHEGGKVARFVIDLEMPASEFDDEADTDTQQCGIDIERESELGLSSTEAADIIVAISQLKINNPAPSSPQSGALLWFADVVLSGSDKQDLEPESESEDLFESMTLKLEEIKSDDRFGTGEYSEKKFEEESSSQAGGETGYTSLLYTRGRRGPARKRRQRRDFQRDVLPTIASLSRVEVTEDLQMIGGLMRACGQEFESALTRRAGRSGSNAKGKRQQRSPQVNPPVRTPPQSSSPQENLPPSTSHQVKPEQNSPHINSHQRIPKANQQPRPPPANQSHEGTLMMGPPQNVLPEYQQLRAVQPNQPKKITLVNHAHRFTPSNHRQKVTPVNLSQSVPPLHHPNGVNEVGFSNPVPVSNQTQKSAQSNQPHRGVPASESQRIPVTNSQQTFHHNSDIEREGLSVIGWGRTTARRNRRPRGLPLVLHQQQSGNNNPPMPLN